MSQAFVKFRHGIQALVHSSPRNARSLFLQVPLAVVVKMGHAKHPEISGTLVI